MNDFMDFFNHKKEVNYFSIFELFEHAIKLVQMSSREKVEIVYNMQSDIEMFGYRSELIQVLLISINNSMDAFITSKTKKPKIELSAIRKEDYVYFTLEDNGGGIPDDILDKIYEPYFTSKPKTQGTGLGLYIMKIIIEKSMLGELSLENSEEGVICRFKIVNLISSEKLLV
jgi:C4-dicarboxylate-specific signal transduction histidine kinase